MSLVNKMLKDLSERERASSNPMHGLDAEGRAERRRGLAGRIAGLLVIAAVVLGGLWYVFGPKEHPVPQPRAALQAASLAAAPAQTSEPLVAPPPSGPDGPDEQPDPPEASPLSSPLRTRAGMTFEEAFRAGQEAEQRGDLALADRRYCDVLLADPTVKPVREALVQLRMDRNHLVGARRVLNRGFELDAEHEPFARLDERLRELEAQRKASKAANATPAMERAKPAPPPSPEADRASAQEHYEAALKLLADGNTQAAERRLINALEADPRLHAAREKLGVLQVSQQRWPEAERTVQAGFERSPERVGYRRLAARLELARDRPAKAAALLERDPPAVAEDAEYHGLLASAYQRMNRHEEASRGYRELLKVQPREGRWWAGYGISLEALADPEGAARAYRQALQEGALDHAVRAFVTGRLDALRTEG